VVVSTTGSAEAATSSVLPTSEKTIKYGQKYLSLLIALSSPSTTSALLTSVDMSAKERGKMNNKVDLAAAYREFIRTGLNW
jgi:hypothetical protein